MLALAGTDPEGVARRRMKAPGAEAPQAPRSSAEGASRFEHRRREDRGAEGAEGVTCVEGVSPFHWGMGLGWGCGPSQKIFFDF